MIAGNVAIFRNSQFLELHLRSIFGNIWFQIFGGLVFAVLFPAIGVWVWHQGDLLDNIAVRSSIVAAIAFLTAFLSERLVRRFPGVRASSFILLACFVPFSAIAIVLIFLNFDYSRSILLLNFACTVSWLIGVSSFARRYARPAVAIVPGARTNRLMRLDGAVWTLLDTPPRSLEGIETVAVDLEQTLDRDWESFLVECALAATPVYDQRHLAESLTGLVQIDQMSENDFTSMVPSPALIRLKQLVDFILAILALPVLIVFSVVFIPLIWLSAGRAPIFVQERIGYRGQKFNILKFKTMRDVASGIEESENPLELMITKRDDKRITRIGYFMRRYRIDELPQIINILRGEMSWFGPRPEAVPLSLWYQGELAAYPYRHVVRPGISGWAQVNQGHVTSTDQVLEKLQNDFFYIKYLSPWLDVLIALKTVRIILFGSR